MMHALLSDFTGFCQKVIYQSQSSQSKRDEDKLFLSEIKTLENEMREISETEISFLYDFLMLRRATFDQQKKMHILHIGDLSLIDAVVMRALWTQAKYTRLFTTHNVLKQTYREFVEEYGFPYVPKFINVPIDQYLFTANDKFDIIIFDTLHSKYAEQMEALSHRFLLQGGMILCRTTNNEQWGIYESLSARNEHYDLNLRLDIPWKISMQQTREKAVV